MATDDRAGVPHDAGVEEARERVELNRKAEFDDRADAAMADVALRHEFGEANFHQGRRLVDKHIAELPAAERARLENATTKEGGRALHDPSILRALAREALGPMPTSLDAVNAELEASRKRMSGDRNAWFADDKAQLRYRFLLEARARIKG